MKVFLLKPVLFDFRLYLYIKKYMNFEKQTINKKYYQDLSKFETLTKHQIKDLYILINQNDSTALNKLITSNLRLVIHFAKQYKSILNKVEAIELDDLISEGNIGLIKAVNRYNPDLDIQFSYYSSFWIKKAINEFIAKEGYTIRSPQNKLLSDNKIAVAVNRLFQQNQYEVFENDIQALNQFSESEISHYFHSKPNTLRIEDDTNINFTDGIEESDDTEKKNMLRYYLNLLNPRERSIIEMYHGYDNEYGERLTTQEIADKLNVSRQRINQIRVRAINKLKELIG